jgi:hypothetical protein
VGTYPFSKGQLKVLAVGALMFALNHLLLFIAGKIAPEPSLAFRIVEAVIRTGIVGVPGLLMVYFGNVSEDVNRLIRKGARKMMRR